MTVKSTMMIRKSFQVLSLFAFISLGCNNNANSSETERKMEDYAGQEIEETVGIEVSSPTYSPSPPNTYSPPVSDAWSMNYFIDEFGDLTDDIYLSYNTTAKRVIQDYLSKDESVMIIIDEDGLKFLFRNSILHSEFSGYENWKIKIKLSDGTILSQRLKIYRDRLGLFVRWCVLCFQE